MRRPFDPVCHFRPCLLPALPLVHQTPQQPLHPYIHAGTRLAAFQRPSVLQNRHQDHLGPVILACNSGSQHIDADTSAGAATSYRQSAANASVSHLQAHVVEACRVLLPRDVLGAAGPIFRTQALPGRPWGRDRPLKGGSEERTRTCRGADCPRAIFAYSRRANLPLAACTFIGHFEIMAMTGQFGITTGRLRRNLFASTICCRQAAAIQCMRTAVLATH